MGLRRQPRIPPDSDVEVRPTQAGRRGTLGAGFRVCCCSGPPQGLPTDNGVMIAPVDLPFFVGLS